MVEHLYGEMFPVVSISVAFAILTIAIGIREADPVLYGLGAFGAVWSVGRVASMLAYRHYYQPRNAAQWEMAYAVGSVGFSACLSLTVAYTFLYSEPESQILSSGLLFAYGGGMVARISLVPWICTLNLTILAVVPGIALLVTPDYYTKFLLILLLLMYGGGLMTVGIIHKAVEGFADSQRRLKLMANTDSLTGVLNRTAMNQHIAECVALQADNELIAVHFIDLDRFGEVNETHGHIVGDEVLRMVADRLRLMKAPTDFVARYGGDEFIVIQSHIRDRKDAQALGQTIVQVLCEPYQIEDMTIDIGARDGIAVAGRKVADLNALLAACGRALQAARTGPGHVAMVEVGAPDVSQPASGGAARAAV